jgi:hypothetical protein
MKSSNSMEMSRGRATRRLSTGSRLPVCVPLQFSFKCSANFLTKRGGFVLCRVHIRPLQTASTAPNRAVIQFLRHSWNLQLCHVIRIKGKKSR